jgi:glycosyltransferase involved in cell wall biosynthesis
MSLDPIRGGGSAERTFQMSRFLARNGIQCTIITTDIGLTPQRIKDLKGVDIIALPTLLKRFYLPKYSLRQIREVVKNVDIVHLMDHWTFINILVYLIARRLKKPYVICPAGALPIFGRSKKIKRIYNKVIGYKIVRNASGWIAISPDEIDHFISYGIDKEKVILIPNGVDPSNFYETDGNVFRNKFGIGDVPFILFMGRLNLIKGPDLILKSFCSIHNKFSQYHLVFAGPDGGMLPVLRKIASESSAENRVHFIGYIGGADKVSAYFAADLLVIPSRQEAMSIVVLEAGITGTPVLLTDRCGFSAVAEIGGGKVVSATIDGLHNGLVELLSQPDNLKKMGERLYRYTIKNFTWEIMIDKYVELFSKILKGNPKKV